MQGLQLSSQGSSTEFAGLIAAEQWFIDALHIPMLSRFVVGYAQEGFVIGYFVFWITCTCRYAIRT